MQKGEGLYLLDKNKSRLIGPYNNKNVHPSLDYIFSDAVSGDEVYVVFKSPSRTNVKIIIRGVGYDYLKNGNNEAGCQQILCSSGNCWRIEAQSVARMEYFDGVKKVLQNGTGTLINDVSGDFTPYTLTARHNLYGGTNNCNATHVTVPLGSLKFVFYAWYSTRIVHLRLEVIGLPEPIE